MGSVFSGRHGERRRQPYLDELPPLHFEELAKRGLLEPGVQFASNRAPTKMRVIKALVEPGLLTLVVQFRRKVIESRVAFIWRPQARGGKRAVAICPCCATRVRILRLWKSHWRCRHCIPRPYRSSSASDAEKAARGLSRLARSIGRANGLRGWAALTVKPRRWGARRYLRSTKKAIKYLKTVNVDADLERSRATSLRMNALAGHVRRRRRP